MKREVYVCDGDAVKAKLTIEKTGKSYISTLWFPSEEAESEKLIENHETLNAAELRLFENTVGVSRGYECAMAGDV